MGDKGGKGEDIELTCDAVSFLTGAVEMLVRYRGNKTQRSEHLKPGGGQVRGQGRIIYLKVKVQTMDTCDVIEGPG